MDYRELDAWFKQAEVVGRAQERCLSRLLIAGVFFLAVPESGALVRMPGLDLELRAEVVRASGPLVLGLLLVAAMGALRAFRSVQEAFQRLRVDYGPAMDQTPNALDFIFHTFPTSPRWQRRWFLLAYPFYLLLFVALGIWLFWRDLDSLLPLSVLSVLLGIGLIVLAWGTTRVVAYWRRNLRRIWESIIEDKERRAMRAKVRGKTPLFRRVLRWRRRRAGKEPVSGQRLSSPHWGSPEPPA